ncbi:hypothetical protein BpHYR1_011360 [Brachionus plicatilis]|uniref:Endonuclease/exonuclease/phosphatase domain-containing protein n=1 Tax=Brachionus plicatilis TaxID=10195 RepID=A0A3M7SLT8_BRAPC|nr:hypothetical protein BpHYR1_011360 [Brachionus plicatilis]
MEFLFLEMAVIIQWNCNNLVSKLELFKNFLDTYDPDIVLLCELKVDELRDNFYINFSNFYKVSKPRINFGGGVAILINKKVELFQACYLTIGTWNS